LRSAVGMVDQTGRRIASQESSAQGFYCEITL
jgi:hypothetical protein